MSDETREASDETVIDLTNDNPRQISHDAVEALVGDIVHIFREIRPGSEWPMVATAVLEHHNPPVPDDELDAWYGQVQERGRFLLRALEAGNVEAIRRAIAYFREITNVDRLLADKDNNPAELVVPE